MKKTDIAMIILIAAVSAGIAYFVASSVFGSVSQEGISVDTIDPITSVVAPVDTNIFNDTAINPSIEVNINNTDETTESTNDTN